jgi:predicted amidophosphoribosyltransferase
MFCLTCTERISHNLLATEYLCASCWLSLNSLRISSHSFIPSPLSSIDPRGTPLYSLFEYRGISRQVILGAKMRGDWLCLDFIRREFRRLIVSRPEFSRIEVVTSAPSSLWGRLRLRINIADYLARDFCKLYKLSYFGLPLSDSLRLQKRARSHSKRWSLDEIRVPSKSKPQKYQDVNRKRLLVIDDIVTSGLTLASIGVQFSESDIQFLTFASAYSPN